MVNSCVVLTDSLFWARRRSRRRGPVFSWYLYLQCTCTGCWYEFCRNVDPGGPATPGSAELRFSSSRQKSHHTPGFFQRQRHAETPEGRLGLLMLFAGNRRRFPVAFSTRRFINFACDELRSGRGRPRRNGSANRDAASNVEGYLNVL